MKIKLAIDSGWSGAMAAQFKSQVWTVECPETYFDMFTAIKEIKSFADNEGWVIDCVLEQVHAMPKQNVKATWSQCENYTAYQMALTALSISHRLVTPQKWMKIFGSVPSGPDSKKIRKKFFVERMQMLHPNLKVTLKNADALAILSVFDKL